MMEKTAREISRMNRMSIRPTRNLGSLKRTMKNQPVRKKSAKSTADKKQKPKNDRRKTSKKSPVKHSNQILSETLYTELKFKENQELINPSKKEDTFVGMGDVKGYNLFDTVAASPSGLTRLSHHQLPGTPSALGKASVATSTPVLSARKSSGTAAELMDNSEDLFADSVFLDKSPSKDMFSPSRNQTNEDHSGDHTGMESIFLDCPCGRNEVTNGVIVQCSSCEACCHCACLELGQSTLEQIEDGHIDWLCPRCQKGQEEGGSFHSQATAMITDSVSSQPAAVDLSTDLHPSIDIMELHSQMHSPGPASSYGSS